MKKINNKFLDLIMLFISLLLTIYRSMLLLFWIKKKINKNYFLDSLNYFGEIWPKYYWKKPTLYKIWTLIWDFLNHIFYNKNKKNEK